MYVIVLIQNIMHVGINSDPILVTTVTKFSYPEIDKNLTTGQRTSSLKYLPIVYCTTRAQYRRGRIYNNSVHTGQNTYLIIIMQNHSAMT